MVRRGASLDANQTQRHRGDRVHDDQPSIRIDRGPRPHVRFGSKADLTARLRNVRFTPESRHRAEGSACPLSANSGHQDKISLLAFDGVVGARKN